jgi:adhesin transport system outer membrane protein
MRNYELLNTAQANVEINEEIFKKVQKLYEAGLTTLSEVNKIESSLSLAKSNYVVQENTLLDVKFNLQRILGRYLDVKEMKKPVLNIALPASIEEAAQYAMKNNPSLLVASYNIKLAQATYKENKAGYYPSIDIEISQSMNRNLSGVEGDDNRLRAMAYLRYNLFNGFSDKASIQKSVSGIHQEVETKNDLRRQVLEGLNLSWAANEKLGDQIEHLNEYKKFALKTLTLYSKEYDLGRRSLLDLLSAQNDFIGAKQQIINTEYSMLFAKYRILDAMGILVQTILKDIDLVYSNVGLKGATPENLDRLPILYDKDLDLIVDELDICNNSLKSEMRSVYGCKFTFEDTDKIDRYTGFYFNDGEDDAATLSEEGLVKINLLIKQLKPYGFANLKFEVLGNVDDDDMSALDKLELSKQRAITVKDTLVKAGAKEENITIYANSDKAPMYSRESSESIEKNNRVDIVVKKLYK